MQNVILFSLPRSGSTWMSNRLSKLYRMNLIDEPLRQAFGTPGQELFHSKVLRKNNFNDKSFCKKVNGTERVEAKALYDFLNTHENMAAKN